MMKNATVMMSIKDAIENRKSVRTYIDDGVDAHTINMLLAAAVRAPTAIHEEQWGFVVVQGKPLLQHISEQARALFVAEQTSQPGQAKHISAMFNDPNFNIFYDANTLIVICGESNGSFVEADCWLAAENLMLMACAFGLGTCVIGSAVTGLNSPFIKDELGMSNDVRAVVPIIIGVPRGETIVTHRNTPHIIAWTGHAE